MYHLVHGTTIGHGSAGSWQATEAATARQRLLDAVVAHFTADGLADQSLRRIAEAVGSSHRMLLYHFGSKDGLLLAVVREVESRTQERLAALGDDALGETDVLIRRMWSYLSDPTLGDFERLFFALYGRALQGDDAIRSLLDDDVAHWLDANVALAGRARRAPPTWRRTHAARLGRHPRPAARPARHGRRRPASTPRSRRSRAATPGAGGRRRRRAQARATAPRRGRDAPG